MCVYPDKGKYQEWEDNPEMIPKGTSYFEVSSDTVPVKSHSLSFDSNYHGAITKNGSSGNFGEFGMYSATRKAGRSLENSSYERRNTHQKGSSYPSIERSWQDYHSDLLHGNDNIISHRYSPLSSSQEIEQDTDERHPPHEKFTEERRFEDRYECYWRNPEISRQARSSSDGNFHHKEWRRGNGEEGRERQRQFENKGSQLSPHRHDNWQQRHNIPRHSSNEICFSDDGNISLRVSSRGSNTLGRDAVHEGKPSLQEKRKHKNIEKTNESNKKGSKKIRKKINGANQVQNGAVISEQGKVRPNGENMESTSTAGKKVKLKRKASNVKPGTDKKWSPILSPEEQKLKANLMSSAGKKENISIAESSGDHEQRIPTISRTRYKVNNKKGFWRVFGGGFLKLNLSSKIFFFFFQC